MNNTYYPTGFCKKEKAVFSWPHFWACHCHYTLSFAVAKFLKRRRDVAWSPLPDGALGKVMFCHDLGIILECCYYWKRVPSGHRPSFPQKCCNHGGLSNSSSLESGLPGFGLWLDDECWHPQASIGEDDYVTFIWLLHFIGSSGLILF